MTYRTKANRTAVCIVALLVLGTMLRFIAADNASYAWFAGIVFGTVGNMLFVQVQAWYDDKP